MTGLRTRLSHEGRAALQGDSGDSYVREEQGSQRVSLAEKEGPWAADSHILGCRKAGRGRGPSRVQPPGLTAVFAFPAWKGQIWLPGQHSPCPITEFLRPGEGFPSSAKLRYWEDVRVQVFFLSLHFPRSVAGVHSGPTLHFELELARPGALTRPPSSLLSVFQLAHTMGRHTPMGTCGTLLCSPSAPCLASCAHVWMATRTATV